MTQSQHNTARFSPTSNIIEFGAYKKRTPHYTYVTETVPPFEADSLPQYEAEYTPAVMDYLPHNRHRPNELTGGLFLDGCASMAVIVMTLAMTLKILG